MLRFACAIAVIAIGFVIAAPSHATPNDVVHHIHNDMVAPSVRINDNCSGTLVYSQRDPERGHVTTYVLTAAHCVVGEVSDTHRVDIPVYAVSNRLIEEHVHFARLTAQSTQADLALLRLIDRRTPFSRVAAIAPASCGLRIGEDAWAAAFPAGGSITITRGLLGPLERRDFFGGEREYYRATPAVAAGSSGGGLYRMNERGRFELIGLASGVFSAGAFMALYTPLFEIAEFMRQHAPIDRDVAER